MGVIDREQAPGRSGQPLEIPVNSGQIRRPRVPQALEPGNAPIARVHGIHPADSRARRSRPRGPILTLTTLLMTLTQDRVSRGRRTGDPAGCPLAAPELDASLG